MNKQKVVVIGISYSSRLCLVRSLARVGYEVSVIQITGESSSGRGYRKPYDAYSKYVKALYCCHKDREELLSILKNIKDKDESQKIVLIPDCDFSVSAIDSLHNQLKDYFLFPNIRLEQGEVIAWMDKVRQKELAMQVGLHVAGATIISIQDGKYIIPENISYPCFPKPLTSAVGGKGGMVRCDNQTQLRSALDKIVAERVSTLDVMVEDYKEIETEYAVVGLSDGEHVVIPGIITLLSVSRSHKGIANRGQISPIMGFESLIEKFRQFVIAVGFVGMFDIDFYQADGTYFFGELNLRFGGSGYAAIRRGVNLPVMLVKHLTGESIEGMQQEVKTSAYYTNERMCLDDYASGCITHQEYKYFLKNADIRFVYDKDDPKPYRQFQKGYRIVQIKKIIKRVLGRK